MAFLFDQATQEAALPPEQRTITLEQVCKATGIQMDKYDVSPYLEEMKDEIEVSYPQDILSIITDRKKAATVGSGSSSAQNDATTDVALPSAQNLIGTSEPALNSGPFTSG